MIKNKKQLLLLFGANLVFAILLLLGYCHLAPSFVRNGTNITNIIEWILIGGLFASTGGYVIIFLYELISKKMAKPIFYLLAAGASLNPVSAGAGFVAYKQNGGKVSGTKLGLVVYILILLSSVWLLNISRILLNFLFTADGDKKADILSFLYLYKFLWILVAVGLLALPHRLLPKLSIIYTILEFACVPVSLTATAVAIFARSQLSIIKYEIAAESGKDKLPDDVLVRMEHVGIGFGRGLGTFQVVRDLNLDICKGETLGLVGESGSGKTTIGRAIIGVNKTNSGKIIFHDKIINASLPGPIRAEVKKGIQMIFQDPAASLNERTTVDYIISEGLRSFHLYKNEADRAAKVQEAIESVGLLPEHLSRYPHEFSGGQRQRIGIARAIIMRPELIIADEPISALDVSIRAQVLNLLKEFQKERGLTYLFIAHDLSVVRYVADRIAVIYKGEIVELAPSEELFKNPMHPYTRSLLSAIPVPDPKLERNKTIIRYVPDGLPGRELIDIGNKHFVRATEKEAKEYKKQLK